MDAVCHQDVEGCDRAARLAWRAEVFSIAIQRLGIALSDPDDAWSGGEDPHGWLAHIFDLGLIAASGLFDPAFYLSSNPDVARADIDPLEHFLRYGGAEGRWPGPSFDSALYLASYADLRPSGLNPLLHYLKHGLVEGRRLGTPVIHPPPARAAQIPGRDGAAWTPGLFELPADLSSQDGYAAVLALQAQHTALEAAAEGLRAVVERRDHELLALQSELVAARTSAQAREAELLAEAEALRRTRDEAELKRYVTESSLQRTAARADALAAAVQAAEQQAQVRAAELRRHDGERGTLEEAPADALSAALAAAQARETELLAQAEVLRQARDEAELKRYVTESSLQRTAARADALAVAVQAAEQQAEVRAAELRHGGERGALEEAQADALSAALAAAQAREAELLAEAELLRRALDESELKRYVAEASLQRAVARTDALMATVRAGTEAAAARRDLESVRSELAETGRDLAGAARELMRTGRDLHRLQSDEAGHLEARAERDALRLQVALLERDVQRGREQEAALVVSRAEAAVLAERVRVSWEALEQLRGEAPSLAAIADAVRAGLAARNTAVAGQIPDARDRTGRLASLDTGTGEPGRAIAEVAPDSRLSALRRLYLDLLEAALAGRLPGSEERERQGASDPSRHRRWRDRAEAEEDWAGILRTGHLRRLVEAALEEHVEGDLVAAGIRHGETAIYLRGVLAAHGVTDRIVWVADAPAALHGSGMGGDADEGRRGRSASSEAGLPVETVEDRFARFGLLDDQVAFLPGRYGATRDDILGKAPFRRLAVLWLGDTRPGAAPEALEALYPKVAPGGFVIIDDGVRRGCRAAIEDYRARQNISGPLVAMDGAAVYWRKAR